MALGAVDVSLTTSQCAHRLGAGPVKTAKALSGPGVEPPTTATLVITRSPGRHYALITIVPPGTGANLDVQRNPSADEV